MLEESKCVLCQKETKVSSAPEKNAYSIECDICGHYLLASPELFEKSYTEMPREKRAMLSAYTRNLFEHGEEPPELGDPDLLKEIIAEYENKKAGEKIKNLIWYTRKKSSQFGDSVPFDPEKDFPITYSLSPQEFTDIINSPFGQNLIISTELGLKLTGEGWKLGNELMESGEEGEQ